MATRWTETEPPVLPENVESIPLVIWGGSTTGALTDPIPFDGNDAVQIAFAMLRIAIKTGGLRIMARTTPTSFEIDVFGKEGVPYEQ